ncbi:UNVERIFIED_CONTAM: hypothetical protein Slati_0944500 [Sesamum latifolium]|uniref:Zinc knuckle CX2CX4HX4C domain-containing protein n=1 Tax=Sesamum latifolium TaxID=2727402 RepID=A0AAW2XR16_9LAMI
MVRGGMIFAGVGDRTSFIVEGNTRSASRSASLISAMGEVEAELDRLRKRALEGCPWSFERNIIILKPIGELENSRQVVLDECDFHVHIHDLPLSMMNMGVATLIGNKIGVFWDIESDDTGCSWGATLRFWVSLKVNLPLRRALKLRSLNGKELLVRFIYERLPNFYYLCGCFGHIDKYCEVRFEQGFRDSGNDAPYSPWLKAPTPGRGHIHGSLSKKLPLSSSSSLPRQPSRTRATILGYSKAECRSPLGLKRSSRDTIGGVAVLEHQSYGCRGLLSGIKGGLPHIGARHLVEQENKLSLNLVNIPLQFTPQDPFSDKGVARRGRGSGRGARGHPRKRSSGVPIIKFDGAFVNEAKRRLNLVDASSNSISAETVGQSRQET